MEPAPPVQKRTLLAKRAGEKVGERKDGRWVLVVVGLEDEGEAEEGMADGAQGSLGE